jgi:hypothetical protein
MVAKLTIWGNINFGGYAYTFSESVPDLREIGRGFDGNWNDELQSFKVYVGQWQMFEHVHFGGLATRVFGPGTEVNDVRNEGFPLDWISSIKKISD